MLASINNSKKLPKLGALDEGDGIGEDEELNSSINDNLEDMVRIDDRNYSTSKPTIRRQDFYND